jgi:hypothetical protein
MRMIFKTALLLSYEFLSFQLWFESAYGDSLNE